jgi:DNA polymerase-3 subunit delta'
MEHGVFKRKNWPLSGNDQVYDFLEKSVLSGRLAHTYILLGPKDIGKFQAAISFAKVLLCQGRGNNSAVPCGVCRSCKSLSGSGSGQEVIHGDFHVIKRNDGRKNISIEDVREFIRLLSLSSFLNSYKVGIIKDADELSLDAANALLKTLEEPKEKVVVLLTASRLDSLPATIVSRSQVLRFNQVKTSSIYDYLVDELSCDRDLAKVASRLSLGRPALAARFAQEKDFSAGYMEKASVFLDFFGADINARLSSISSLLDDDGDEDKVEKAATIISIWQGAVRDILLLSSNNGNVVQHEEKREKIVLAASESGPAGILRMFKILREGEERLRANVNPKLVLESIAINI